MRYTAAFKLTGPLAAAAAVEWTDIDAPLDSGAGWEACVKLSNGDWRLSSHAIAGETAWRDPGLFDNIGLRYRLGANSPWSPVSASRKEIILVAVIESPAPGRLGPDADGRGQDRRGGDAGPGRLDRDAGAQPRASGGGATAWTFRVRPWRAIPRAPPTI